MARIKPTHFLLALLAPLSAHAASLVNLGTASSFAALGAAGISNTGASVVSGDIGVGVGSSISGFQFATLNGTSHTGDAVASQAFADATTAYGIAAGQSCDSSLTGQDLGGLTLNPGTYCFSSSAQLTGALTLNFLGNPNSVFVFQISSALTTASNSSIVFANGGQGNRVFWQVGSSATLGTGTQFTGTIIALAAVTLTTGADITCGRAFALTESVTLDTNNVSIGTSGCNVNGDPAETSTAPEPATAQLCAVGVLLCAVMPLTRLRRKRILASQLRKV